LVVEQQILTVRPGEQATGWGQSTTWWPILAEAARRVSTKRLGRPGKRPGKPHADKGYDYQNYRNRLLVGSWETGRMEIWLGKDFGSTLTGPQAVHSPDPQQTGRSAGLIWVAGADNVVHVNDEGTGWIAIPPPG
jgi:hypothetical protein